MKLNLSQITMVIVTAVATVLMFFAERPDLQCFWSILMFVAATAFGVITNKRRKENYYEDPIYRR